jgi:signal transduction histidine kinase
VLTNLVGNAAKYSPAGTTVRVHVREEGGQAVLHVDDEGAGVAPADRDRVFSRFYRGSGDAVTNTRGAGLGLAIVHEFAASMGGVASVTEAPSGGARFTVRFPLADRTDTSLPVSRATSEGTTDVLT